MFLRFQRETTVDALTLGIVLIVLAYFISIGGSALFQGALR